MSVLTIQPQFLYPYSRQFPFDEVAEKIVKALEKRNWKVPGINVEFGTYGSGEAKYQLVRYITGENFKLYFCRVQARLGNRFNDTAALHTICIPKQMLEVFEDESGPVYYLYVGNNWDSEKEWFMNQIKIDAKSRKEPRRYLKYAGTTYKERAEELISYTDLNREYSPIGDEPVRINLEQKFNEFTKWLEENVLKYILSFPEESTIQPPVPLEELIPYTGPWHTIYSVCNGSDVVRLMTGKKDPSELPPEERHAYFGSGRRLVPLGVDCNGRFPEIAHDGFIWCDANPKEEVTQHTNLAREVMIAMGSYFYNDYIVAINLKYANHVYVADNSKYTETRQQLFKDIAPRDRLTDKELGQAFASRGATIVPITEYKGDYKEPIVLINRELDFDEIEKIFIDEE